MQGSAAKRKNSRMACPRTCQMARRSPRAWYQAERLETPVVRPTEVRESRME